MSITESYCKTADNKRMKKLRGDYDQHFAARFQELCQEQNLPWKQEAIAKFIRKSGATAWGYMHGSKLPSIPTARDLAARFGCCVEWLLTGEGPKRPWHDFDEAVQDAIRQKECTGELLNIGGLPEASRHALIATYRALAQACSQETAPEPKPPAKKSRPTKR
jgi:hypothetical protein